MKTRLELRPHQEEAETQLAIAIRGIINLPTGTGKTLIQSRSISKTILANNNAAVVYVIMSPRILLSNQLLGDIKEDLMLGGKDCQYLIVNSGRVDDELYGIREKDLGLTTRDINATTNSTKIKEDYERAQKENVPLIISSTYHSADRIVQSGIPVEVIYCDEAHYLVRQDFNWINTEEFPANKKFFFTATLRETPAENGMGMNVVERFGEVLYQKLPIEMIKAGETVRPKMHIVRIDDKVKGNSADGAAIASAFIEHDSQTNESAKLLVVARNTPHLDEIVCSEDMQRFLRTHPNLTLFDISSEHGARINGDKVKRGVFMKRLQNLKNNDQAIIVHIDILAEGIDVPGITGIMPLDSQSRSKFLQTLGRATRLHVTDRKNLYDNIIKPEQLDEMIKPYAWIIVPAYGDFGEDLKEQIKLTVEELRTYGFNPSEDIVVKNKSGKCEKLKPEDREDIDEKINVIAKYTSNILHVIEDEEKVRLEHEEEIRISKLSKDDLLFELFGD